MYTSFYGNTTKTAPLYIPHSRINKHKENTVVPTKDELQEMRHHYGLQLNQTILSGKAVVSITFI
jgi:hypothetical protein